MVALYSGTSLARRGMGSLSGFAIPDLSLAYPALDPGSEAMEFSLYAAYVASLLLG